MRMPYNAKNPQDFDKFENWLPPYIPFEIDQFIDWVVGWLGGCAYLPLKFFRGIKLSFENIYIFYNVLSY